MPTEDNLDLSRIYGFVRDQDGVAVSGVGVALTGPTGGVVTVESGEQTGAYVFWSLLSTMGEGEYRLTIPSLPAGYSIPPSQPHPVLVPLFSDPGEARADLVILRD